MLLDISGHYPWAMGVLLGDVHPFEQERLNNLMPLRGVNFQPSDLQSKMLHTQPFQEPFEIEINSINYFTNKVKLSTYQMIQYAITYLLFVIIETASNK